MTIYLKWGQQNRKEWANAWQAFLIGSMSSLAEVVGEVDGDFQKKSDKGTRLWQKEHGLTSDGAVGRNTLLKAIDEGFDPPDSWLARSLALKHIDEATYDRLADTDLREGRSVPESPEGSLQGYMDPSYPPVDGDGDGRADAIYVSSKKVFGEFAYAPVTGSKSGRIEITDGWDDDNIITIDVPQLEGVRKGGRTSIKFNRNVAAQLLGFFQEVEEAGLLHLVKSWAGAFYPRFIRGSRTSLSNHSWGTAFDINVPWNGLGKQPALVGQEGQVRSLVPIAEKWGFYWGGRYRRRKDGMHFEAVEIMSGAELRALVEGLSANDHILPFLEAA